MLVTREMFLAATGQEPENDDLERCNCQNAGKLGHYACGWNTAHNKPQFWCGFTNEPTGSNEVTKTDLARRTSEEEVREWFKNLDQED